MRLARATLQLGEELVGVGGGELGKRRDAEDSEIGEGRLAHVAQVREGDGWVALGAHQGLPAGVDDEG